MEHKKLTPKQEQFCQEYIIDLNSTHAAIRAGYSEKTASVIGCENLIKPNIANRLSELKKDRSEKVGVNQEMVLNNLIKAMRISLGEEDSHVVGNVDGMITSVPLKKTDVASFLKVQDMLAKHIGLYEKDNEQLSSSVIQNVVLSDKMAEKLNKDLEDEY
jgi:phage terminase small subunit